MSFSEYQAVRKVGGIADLTRLEHDVLGVLTRWRHGRDGWCYGKRDDIGRVLNVSVRSVTRALASLAAKGVIALARWKYGVCVKVSVAVAITGAWVVRALVEAKRSRQRLAAARPLIWQAAQKVWQNCQCGQDGRTLYGPSFFKRKVEKGEPCELSEPLLSSLSPLDRAIAEGKKLRGIA